MATMVELHSQIPGYVDVVYDRVNDAEKHRGVELAAVLRVQSWFRASRVRSYFRFLHQNAVAIQRRWRGHMGRRKYQEVLKAAVFKAKLAHYNALAAKIQKIWRGYYVRKYVFNYYSRKRYLQGLIIKNEIVRQELDEYADLEEQKAQIKREAERHKQIAEYAKKHHHLISTEVQPGIYNSPFQLFPDEMEFHLRSIKPEPATRGKAPKHKIYDPAYKRYDLPELQPLPPILPRQQGPFRDPREVQKQRYKPFQPSLRVETDYQSLEKARELMKQEEWVTRINDDLFQPFTHTTVTYQPLLHTTSQYGHPPYGTKYFKEEFLDKHITSQNFKSLVPPIPVFDKLNDTYSQGQV